MAAKDGVTLAQTLLDDYLRRIEEICKERRNPQDIQHAMSNPNFKAEQHGLMDRLAAEYARSFPLIERPLFVTARVGTLKNVAGYRQALGATDPVCNISKWAGDITGKRAFAASIPQVEEDVEFVCASNEELGYPNGATRFQSYEAGLKLGWKLCLASDGPEIRRHYLNQPLGEWKLIAMEPISDSDGDLKVFNIEHNDDGLWLNTNYDNPDNVWNASNHWVFRHNFRYFSRSLREFCF